MADDTKTKAKTEPKPAPAAKAEPKAAPAEKASESAAPAAEKPAKATGGQNGKGDGPRNCFSPKYRSNFDAIDWSK